MTGGPGVAAPVDKAQLPPAPGLLPPLRHGAATLALAAGADLKVIQAMLGHASIVLTADSDTSVLPVVARSTAEVVAAEILRAARTPPGHHRTGTHRTGLCQVPIPGRHRTGLTLAS